MTPGEPQDVPIFRGARWSFDFLFVVTATDDPLDLTNLGPFVCEIKDLRADRVIVVPTVTSAYDDTGTINISMTPEQTRSLPLGNVRIGLRDYAGDPFLEWTPEVKWFTPNIP